jgi:peroxiredoxin
MSDQQLPSQAPDFTLDHILGHSVSLSDFPGRTVVVVFGGRDSATQVAKGISTLRDSRDPDELPIIGVSDLRSAPRAARIIVKNQLKKAYEASIKAAAERTRAAGKAPGADQSKDVIMVMDWSGGVVDAFGLRDVDKQAVGVVIDADRRIRGAGSGEQLGAQVLTVLAST